MELSREDKLLNAWVKLSGILKNSRITKGLAYNESIVMLFLYQRYCEDGIGMISVQEIIRETQMLKSLVNRTINSLESKGMLEKCRGEKDKRTLFVKCVKDKLNVFLDVHNSSLDVAGNILRIIGDEDADHFIRIVEKIDNSGYKI